MLKECEYVNNCLNCTVRGTLATLTSRPPTGRTVRICDVKLEAYGVTGDLQKYFQSYSENRKQLVSLEGFESTEMTIRHGVPQGSILGPLLFVIFINDMRLHINSEAETELYADDTTIMASADVNCIAGLEESLNMCAENIESWSIINKLPLNEGKTKVLTITGKRLAKKIMRLPNVKINGKQLDNVNCASLLGLKLEEKLTFDAHVEKLCKKMSQHIAVLKKIRHCLPFRQRKLYIKLKACSCPFTLNKNFFQK